MNNLIWICNIKQYLISNPLDILSYPVFLRNIHMLHDSYFTSTASSSEIPDKNIEKKYQHEKAYKPRKCHIYIEMISKCKFQMACNPWNINHSQNVLAGRQYPHKSKHHHNTTKGQKLKTVVWTWNIIDLPENLYRRNTFYPTRVTIYFI